MTRTEDLLRDALSATARTVEPGTLSPLTAPARRRSTAKWAVPLTAAGALLVLAAAIAIGGQMRGHRQSPPVSGTGPSRMVTIDDGTAVIRDATGRKVAGIPAERGPYVAVAAYGAGRTFYLAASEGRCAISLYRLSFRPDGTVDAPQRVRADAPIEISEDDTAMSVSRDGTRVAVSGACETTYRVSVLDTRSGGIRSWTAPTNANLRYAPSWSPDGRTLAVFWWDVRRNIEKAPILLLDPEESMGGDLSKARVLRPAGIQQGPLKGGRIEAFAYDPDGRTMTVVVSLDAFSAITRISATTGDPVGGFTRVPTFAGGVRPDGSGHHLLLFGSGEVARVDDGRLHWIARGLDNVDAAW
ncbi:hypothetical protein GCM10023196_030620 [Actinoallomurus vinaceus]|uniref:Lipoprotein LpqB beta-propeller domain-containing protein n=1 Tax=Actinoallomurus vinaceus TaxID=1080074 RepID=A0ABP8UB40_9ACTN